MNSLDYQHIFHEIKNSVTLINSSLQLLEQKCPDLKTETHWINTLNEMNYLKKIILEISQTGNTEYLQLETTNLNTTIQQVVSSLQDSYPEIHPILHLDPLLPDLRIDATKMQRALLNLLKNSIEAMNETGSITITTTKSASNIKIDITDCGGGIQPDLEPKIFDLFVTSKPDGTGLGLTITQHILTLHHGSLHLQNTPGTGCTFSICLPLSEAAGENSQASSPPSYSATS